MKKQILTIFTIALTAISAIAQVDFTFDQPWVTATPSNAQNPQGWTSFNVATYPLIGMQQTVFAETTAPYSGTTAAKIVTEVIPSAVQIPNPFRPGHNFDTVGILLIGQIPSSLPVSIKYGDALASPTRYAQLGFACKYAPLSGGDTAFVLAYLTHYNGNGRDTIATGKYTTGATTTAYSLQSITMNYNPAFSTVLADSQFVVVSSSIYSHAGAQKGSTFWIDEMAWSGYTSTNDIAGTKNTVSVFPNPATNNIIITSSMNAVAVEIMDISGRLVGTYSMQNNKVNLQTTDFSRGMYFYNVLTENKEIINRGKFEIAK